jgi:hypothetical protein
MFKMQGARYRRMSAFLIRTYCWGLIPIAGMLFYLGDGDLLARSRCAVVGLFHFHETPSATADVRQPAVKFTTACCASPGEAHGSGASAGSPVLLYSDFGAACSDDRGEGEDCRSGCVYGMNFGPVRGVSTLSVGAVPLATYEKWTDPGAPYASGHYAEICGRISYSLRPGTFGVQLTTPSASSNTLLSNLQNERLLLVGARSGRHSEQ